MFRLTKISAKECDFGSELSSLAEVSLYIHPQELATYLLSYFMGCIAVVPCVLVLRCGLAGIRMQAEALVLQPASGIVWVSQDVWFF